MDKFSPKDYTRSIPLSYEDIFGDNIEIAEFEIRQARQKIKDYRVCLAGLLAWKKRILARQKKGA